MLSERLTDTGGRSLLDPANREEWTRFRQLGHRMVDDIIEHLRTISDRPVWREMPPEGRDELNLPDAGAGVGPEAAYERYLRSILPYGPGAAHPRFWGWVTGTGTLTGVFAEMLAATVNGPAGLFNDVTGEVERAVIEWCRRLMGFPEQASGIITSGGSVANLIGILVARDVMLGRDVARRGVHDLDRDLFVYASDQVHSSVLKALAVSGLGWNALRKIESDSRFRLDPHALRRAVERDRVVSPDAVGIVVASAGTVNTAAVDPIDEIAEVCDDLGLWLHVDGAIGALARLARSARPILQGIERADSLAFDFHKWLYIPYEAGCVLIRDRNDHTRPFRIPAEYLAEIPRGLGGPSLRAGDLGLQLSRGFKALKIWMSLLSEGPDSYASAIERNLELTRALEQMIRSSDALEMAGLGDLNIVCFRYVSVAGLSVDEQNELNREILMRLQERGIAAPSHTTLNGRFAIRCSITNHRTTIEDLELLVESASAIGREIEHELGERP